MALSRSMKNLMHQSAMERKGGGNPGHGGGGMSGMVGRAMQQARARQAPRAPQQPGAEAPSNMIRDRFAAAHRAKIAGQRAAPGTTQPTSPIAIGETVPGLGRKVAQAQRTGGVVGPGGAGGMPRGGVMGGPAGGGTMRPAVMPTQRGGPGTIAGKPMPRPGTGGVVGPGRGTFGFAARGGRGTPTLQQGTASARSEMMRQAAARGAGTGGVIQPPGTPRPADQASRFGAAMKRAKTAAPAALTPPRGQSVASRIGGRQGPPARRGGMARALGSGGSRRRMLR